MSLRLFLLELHLPEASRRRMFRDLVRMTADAFGASPPAVDRLSSGRAVAAFARFTRAESDRLLQDAPAAESVRRRLHEGARDMGRAARRALGVSGQSDVMRALKLLYGAIGIEFEGTAGTGEISIRRCSFSGEYAPETCRFMSALDAGMAEGISGGSLLAFSARITEGAPCCRARLAGPGPAFQQNAGMQDLTPGMQGLTPGEGRR